jgi:hypothetical protein
VSLHGGIGRNTTHMSFLWIQKESRLLVKKSQDEMENGDTVLSFVDSTVHAESSVQK